MMMKCYVYKTIAVVAILAALSGCGAKLHDLEAYVAEVKARPRGKIDALPEYPPYKTYVYNVMAQRAPFERPKPKEEARLIDGVVSARKPDATRQPYPLEQFDITQLLMVGVIGTEQDRQALVKVDGQVYRVSVGDYVGKNEGLVTGVGDESFRFVELVLAGVDIWTERPRVVELTAAGRKE